ncbi:50S ribosomal protein L4 [Candidatus Woesearchaeota archaeon]|nr:50S ribosomal protein L4 [Candidatus Woesearchaeota archaeon]
MKLSVIDISNNKIKEVELPSQFNEEIRPDLVKKAVLTIQNNKRQSYGASPDAGKRASAKLSKRRKAYRGMYGFGISRVPRKILSRRGRRFNWAGAFAPGTVSGRRAHPPRAKKIWKKDINEKERKKAIRSAISATVSKNLVEERGHILPDNYPFVVDSKIGSLAKTKDVKDFLKIIGFENELKRVGKKKIRAGKGKSRGRKYIRKKGMLIVVSKKSKLMDAAKNISGIEVVEIKNLNAEILAPGTKMGRATLWSEDAIDALRKGGLFLK